MIGHQREVLAQLGIDVWIPRDVLCQEIKHTSLWRDQTVSEIITPLNPVLNPLISESPSIIQDSQEQHETVAYVSSPSVVETQEKIEIEAFSLQALVLPHLVIILDVSKITMEQQQLWMNIQRAIYANFFELNWPFAMVDMNDGSGVENYIQGFIDAITSEQKIVSLGGIPYCKNSVVMNLASLQDMLDSPLLKRRLWGFIQNKHMN